MELTQKGKIRIYACGGTGTNIGLLLEKYRNGNYPGFSNLDITYIDTSKSNGRTHIDDIHFYKIGEKSGKELDGSGKLRSENSDLIDESSLDILQKFPPADLNIVISSAGGGSGSIISPCLARDLLNADAPVISLLIGSTDTRLDCENTLKTIKTYESMVKRCKKPIVMMYMQNSLEYQRDAVDNSMVNAIVSLSALFSRENLEIDSKDLFNWLRFDRVTTYQSQLASLTLLINTDTPKEIGNIISVATLVRTGMNTVFPITPDYQCSGFFPETIDSTVLEKAPVHYVVSDGIISTVAKRLNDLIADMQKAQNARIKVTATLTDKDEPTDSGLVI